jgi:hypothetical protein
VGQGLGCGFELRIEGARLLLHLLVAVCSGKAVRVSSDATPKEEVKNGWKF